ELGVSNPLAVIENYTAGNTNYHFVSNLGFEITINENLFFKTNFGLTYNVLKEQLFLPNRGMERYYELEAHNVAKVSNNDFNSLNNISYLKYSKNFGKNHKLFSTTGLNILSNNFEYDWGLTKNAHENDEYREIRDGENNLREIGGSNRVWNWMSFYENVTYSFKDKYLLTASLSIDGSSRVGKNAANTLKLGNTPFGIFYAGGVAWRLSSEPFLNKYSWIEEIKLRATYGKTGNDDIGESSATRYYQIIRFNETVGLYPGTVVNDELTYESVSQMNLGIDIALLGNRIRTSFDVYNSVTDNMLIYSPIESYLGFNYRPENGGQLKNKGWELGAFFRLVDARSFKWDIQANVSTSTNEISEIVGDMFITDIDGAQIINKVGNEANSFYGYIFEGVFSTQAEADAANLINDRDFTFKAGDAKFSDLSGPNGTPDGVINEFDKTIIGSATPEYYGGLSNSFKYKRWTLSAFLQFMTGNELFNFVRFRNEQMSNLFNQSSRVLSRWQRDGQETDVPRANWKDPIGNSAFSTRWIEDGSFMRVKNITLSYNIPDEFLAFQNAEFYVSANNVFTLSKYLGYDPEFGYSHSQIGQGVDYGLSPQPRQFIVGIKLGL
ncbi:MAG: SusC/RagA family TonB-linked outer membrane protein, partial [Mariniphaga sp.]|nr:SusC/RagA family TonB-linked outer membrane protein [Mariniphaga sp.]